MAEVINLAAARLARLPVRPEPACTNEQAAHAARIGTQMADPSDIKEHCGNFERIMISVLPVMAAAAGLDLVEFALDEVTDLHESRFSKLAG